MIFERPSLGGPMLNLGGLTGHASVAFLMRSLQLILRDAAIYRKSRWFASIATRWVPPNYKFAYNPH